MSCLQRIAYDAIDVERTLEFSLPVLRQWALIALRAYNGFDCPVAIASEDAWPWQMIDDCRRVYGCDVQVILVPKAVILESLNQVFDMASASAEQMLAEIADVDDLSKELEDLGDLLESDDEAPVIRLINTLIYGRMGVRIAGRDVDIRVSILPTAFGERVVMRLLNRSAKILTLQDLGMSNDQYDGMKRVVKLPHGIVLVTGPTGSGKSTTLYAALMEVDRVNRNVMTIEDPIEYQVEGVGQMQVKPKIGLDFASGLRSILRQDPDIVMVGEIRDLETAEIAIQASLTGHLVFATLHTNDALSAVVRLHDMGVEPYLIASSLMMVQAQRLVRRLCPECKRPSEGLNDWADLGVSTLCDEPVLLEAVGCNACMHTGFAGRIAIYEMLDVSEEMRNAIHDGAGLPVLRRLARDESMKTLRQDGARHVIAGITTVDEVRRVSMEGI